MRRSMSRRTACPVPAATTASGSASDALIRSSPARPFRAGPAPGPVPSVDRAGRAAVGDATAGTRFEESGRAAESGRAVVLADVSRTPVAATAKVVAGGDAVSPGAPVLDRPESESRALRCHMNAAAAMTTTVPKAAATSRDRDRPPLRGPRPGDSPACGPLGADALDTDALVDGAVADGCGASVAIGATIRGPGAVRGAVGADARAAESTAAEIGPGDPATTPI